MLDALLAPLPDAAYFEQREIVQEKREKLRAEDIPFAAYLRGAAVWDMMVHPSYPVYATTKTNNEDNQGLAIGFGNAVVSSVETGELLTFPMREDSGKIPMADRQKPPRSPSNLPVAKSYSVHDLWRSFKAEELCGGHGMYQAFLRVGNFQSEPYRFKAIPGQIPPLDPPFESLLKSKGVPGKGEFGIQGVTFEAASGLVPPKEPGLTLVHGKPFIDQGIRHFPIHAAFRFKGEWPKDFERMPLHILVTQRNQRQVDVNTLWIPRVLCQFKDGAYSGFVNFDLADLFISPGDGLSKPPKEAWINLVHRGWQGPIEKVELSVPIK